MSKHFVHRLVADSFIDNIDKKDFVNHIDGNKHNNVENLEWVTYRENITHAEINRLYKPKLTTEQVIEMRRLYATGYYTYDELADKFDLSPSYVGRVINKKYYKHV